ncbi:M15 family metallopeptidase [Demequina lutea]|uniref:D-alanyl-D-alanine carboxypeptidase-like core domain-containing protein n=1 Tax=Demequina lutea TaxID=431489 RepID=A0A7Z0CIR3_9MICO|nr:M15 family metallopeptidase [Demequina lutea]NYI42209.1 hypothetical protein [Demequina lutea]
MSTDSLSLFVGNTAVTGVIPAGPYRPIAQPVAATRRFAASRRIKRLTETREIRVRTTHKRRKFVARGGVLAGFGLAMVVYPIMGNVVEYHRNAAEAVPGVVLGQNPTTGRALLGDGPVLIPTVLALPTIDEKSKLAAMADTAYIGSSLLPNCALPVSFDGEVNGELGLDQLCLLPDGKNYLRADAAQNFAQMNAQFKAAFGRDICLLQGYRTYAQQVQMKATRGYLAASPGTSMHGFGVAFDLCGGDDHGAPDAWLKQNAATYGFDHPDWAVFRTYEPWHWEYKPATDAIYASRGITGVADGGTTAIAPAPATTAPATTAPATTAPASPAPVAKAPATTAPASPAPAATKPAPAP